jgi:hypothetical protein
MGKHLIRATAIGAMLTLAVATGARAEPERAQLGNLVLEDDGGISPSKLPRHEQVPISGHIDAHIGTVDGSHPPAVESVTVDFDKTIQVNARGLPVCAQSQLQARSSVDAQRACRDAIVGSGSGEVDVAFPEQEPIYAKGPITLFNGGVHGATTLLLIHTYVNVPAPTAVVVAVKLTHIHRGRYGLRAEARIPAIAGGAGSVTAFKMTIGRTFTYKGKRESYLTASCPTGVYYTQGQARFSDGTTLHLTHALPCTPRD